MSHLHQTNYFTHLLDVGAEICGSPCSEAKLIRSKIIYGSEGTHQVSFVFYLLELYDDIAISAPSN